MTFNEFTQRFSTEEELISRCCNFKIDEQRYVVYCKERGLESGHV